MLAKVSLKGNGDYTKLSADESITSHVHELEDSHSSLLDVAYIIHRRKNIYSM